MDDILYNGRMTALDIAFSFGVCTTLANDAVLKHNCDPVSAHLLGRALTAGVLSSALLGGDDRLNIRWKYDGHVKSILVDSGADGSARGLISPTNLSEVATDRDGIYGESGELQVIRTRDGAVLNSGTIETGLANVVEDLAYFFCRSDQVETGLSVMIGFNRDVERPVDLCQGIMLQALPMCDLERFERIRTRLKDEPIRALLMRKNESDNHFENILNALTRNETEDPGLRISNCGQPRFRCTCSREKMGPVLRAIPYIERMELARKKEDVVVNCQFCNTRYALTFDECISAWNNRPIG